MIAIITQHASILKITITAPVNLVLLEMGKTVQASFSCIGNLRTVCFIQITVFINVI